MHINSEKTATPAPYPVKKHGLSRLKQLLPAKEGGNMKFVANPAVIPFISSIFAGQFNDGKTNIAE